MSPTTRWSALTRHPFGPILVALALVKNEKGPATSKGKGKGH